MPEESNNEDEVILQNFEILRDDYLQFMAEKSANNTSLKFLMEEPAWSNI